MCGSNPELSPEVNSAKCIGGTALGFAIVTLVGLAIVPWGTVSAFAGIFGTIAGGIVCCCGPKTKGEGAGKMNAAGILFIVSAVLHFIAIILPIIGFIILTAAATACFDECDSMTIGGVSTITSCPDEPAGCNSFTFSCSDSADAAPEDACCTKTGGDKFIECTSAAGWAAFIAIFAWPTIILALIAMILEIVAAVKCMGAKKAILAEGGPSVK